MQFNLRLIETIVGSVAVVPLLIAAAFKILQWRWLMQRKQVSLELTPPASVGKAPEATQKLFAVIHHFRNVRSLKDKLLRRPTVLALEIESSRSGGIRYVVTVDAGLTASLHQAINSYLPEVKVKVVTRIETTVPSKLITFKQTGHYAFPLAAVDFHDQHDPAAYLAGALTKLEDKEHIRFQMVLTPVKLREATILAHKILGNEDLLLQLRGHRVPGLSGLLQSVSSGLFGITDMVGEVYHGSTKEKYQASQKDLQQKMQVAKRQRPARVLSAFELELMESIHTKVNEPLFKVSIRAAVSSSDPEVVRTRLGAIKASLGSYTVPSYQSLQTQVSWPVLNRLHNYAFTKKLPVLLGRSCVLSAAEVANIYHFPLTQGAQTDNLITSLSRTLPAPVSLKQNAKLDIVIGRNYHHGTETAIGLSAAEREKHMYVIGGTGNGKTTMLLYSIVQDIKNGKGLAVIDPHGDLAETILRHIPQERLNDVIYLNPDDLSYPIGINLLELHPGLTGDDLLREKDLVTESVISVLRKIFSEDDSGGHRIEYVLRNSIQTALTVEGSTLFTIFRLLNDAKFRVSIVKNLQDEDLKNFWKNELGKAGDFQRVKMAAGITAKIGRFLFSASAKRILEQPKSTIDFDEILSSDKILICNFSKGLLGEDTSALFGTTILAKLQVASLRRARLQQSERTPYYLYVDEFQNFATMSFVQMLSEARKYKLFLTMAEQSTSQQDEQRMVDIILANVGTVVCFRSGSPADERLVLPLFSPYIEQGEIANLPSFSFYMRIAAVHAQEPMSGMTVLLQEEGSTETARQVIALSRAAYAADVEISAQETPVAETVITQVKKRSRKTTVKTSTSATPADMPIL